MTLLFKQKKESASQSTARVVDGKLILSFPLALTPVVWQMDLSQAKASALEVHAQANSDAQALVLKTPKGENLEVAVFATRPEAVSALMAAAGALENAHGQIRPFAAQSDGHLGGSMQPSQSAPKRGGILKTIGLIFLSLVGIFILLNILSAVSPRSQQALEGPGAAQQNTANEPEAGVPLSADEFLNRR